MSDRLKGYLLTLAGVLIITPDALLLRLIEAGHWTVMVWRGLGFFAVLLAIVCWQHGAGAGRALRRTGRLGLLIAVNMSLGQILFVYSIRHTQAANTLVIIAAIPLVTAGLAWLWLGEPVRRRTIVSGVLVLLAVALTMTGGVSLGGTAGDLAALGCVVSLAVLFTALRRAPAIDMLPAIAASGLLSAAMALPLADGLAVGAGDLPLMAVLCLIVSPISFALISLGPRYLPAPEVALLLLVETALGPFWVWLVLAETPSPLTLVGGVLMVTTLAVNSWLLLRTRPQESPAV